MFFNGFQILQESDGARQVLRELVERYNELQKIEKSLIEVNNMFIQLNALVMEQVRRFGGTRKIQV